MITLLSSSAAKDKDYKRAAVAVTLAYIARAVSRHLLQTQT